MLELCADLVISCIKKIILLLTGAAHRIHQKSKYWKTHQNDKTWNISSWNDGTHKTASASKIQNGYTPEQKVFMEIGKNMVPQSRAVKQSQKIWIILQARTLGGSPKEEPKSMKFAKPKCSSCKRNEIRSHREIIFLHTGQNWGGLTSHSWKIKVQYNTSQSQDLE